MSENTYNNTHTSYFWISNIHILVVFYACHCYILLTRIMINMSFTMRFGVLIFPGKHETWTGRRFGSLRGQIDPKCGRLVHCGKSFGSTWIIIPFWKWRWNIPWVCLKILKIGYTMVYPSFLVGKGWLFNGFILRYHILRPNQHETMKQLNISIYNPLKSCPPLGLLNMVNLGYLSKTSIIFGWRMYESTHLTIDSNTLKYSIVSNTKLVLVSTS